MKRKLLKQILNRIFILLLVFYLPILMENIHAQTIEQNKVDKGAGKTRITGVVLDESNQPVIGANVIIEGTTEGAITDINGKFILNALLNSKIKVSYIGYESTIVKLDKSYISIFLTPSQKSLNEVVVVGYGQQKKASIVGAISTTSSKELQRSGGVTNLAQALTGKLTGLTTIQVNSQPGKDDPKMFIRGQGTWNGGEPYILVDGVERRMQDLDMSEVDNISVLKDASATSVYGVKGANGVILVTTKRGNVGKPVISVSANSTIKSPSKLVNKLDSYDMFHSKDAAIAREVVLNPNSWLDYVPFSVIDRYRNQQNLKYPEAYPNVDWTKETIKDYVTDNRVNLNIGGGTEFLKYFSSMAFINQGDLLKTVDNNKGYNGGLGYNRFNFRTNLDFSLTKTTFLKVNIAGNMGNLKETYSSDAVFGDYTLTNGIYGLPPNAFLPRYSDGRWGRSLNAADQMNNPVMAISNSGIRNTRKTDITADLTLTQKLDFVTKGLSITANLSYDNHFETVGGLWDNSSSINTSNATEWIDPKIEDALPGEDLTKYYAINPVLGKNQFDWYVNPWYLIDEDPTASLNSLKRRLYYKAQLNYARVFGKNDVTATGVFTREEYATGSEFLHYREDWVFRATYNYDNKYLTEINGAYNGSEKFGANYRFAFFPSAAIGWNIANEKLMKNITWLDKLKLRYSVGLIGDDGGISQRWLYETQWTYGGNSKLMDYATNNAPFSPYTWYREAIVGNPDIHWEKANKNDIGLEMALFKNMLSANFDYFKEDRTDILLTTRTLPAYYGATPPVGNVGRVKKNGYEIELKFNIDLGKAHLWANASMTHAVDKIIYKEEPQLKDAYLKQAGFQIDQTKSVITDNMYINWDQIYTSVPVNANDQNKLPGYYNLIDYNADGVIDPTKDIAPYGYSNRPQNNYNLTLGLDYKGFSLMLQFYGVNNVTRQFSFANWTNTLDVAWPVYNNYWSVDNPTGSAYLPRWKTTSTPDGNFSYYDGSYVRLKTAEVAYSFSGKLLKEIGVSGMKLYANGNNLFFWSKMPDDREQSGDLGTRYPSTRNINMGIDINF